MEFTVHAATRIHHRTRMRSEDVLYIITNRAAIDLGLAEGRRYFLFHSSPDNLAKIAIVSAEGSLISIFEKHFGLPAGVKRVTRKIEIEARTALQNLIFSRIKRERPQRVCVTIEVRTGAKVHYTRDGGEIPTEDTKNSWTILTALKSQLMSIATIVDDAEGEKSNRVMYDIYFKDPDALGFAERHVTIRHSTIMERVLRPA